MLAHISIGTYQQADIVSRIEKIARDAKLPAVAVHVVSKDGAIFSRAFGTHQWNGDTMASLKDQWHLGSCTKAFTAMEIGYLVDSGRLKFESTLKEAFSNEFIHESLAKVTLRDLLAHRSGLEANYSWRTLAPVGAPLVERRGKIVRHILAQPVHAEKIGSYSYSNAGYFLAGEVAASSKGKPIEELLEGTFKRLGVEKFGFGQMGIADPWPHRGIVPLDPSKGVFDNDEVVTSAGRVHMPITEWGKIGSQHLRGLLKQPTQLPKSYIQELTQSPDSYNAAVGWMRQRSERYGKIYFHVGSNTLNYASIVIVPSIDRAVLVCTNTGLHAQEAVDKITAELLRAHS
ncbi:serine hydrolase domain-containing protein [Kamptonema cortianum]|nr:serine hydrolase domain-containing protein [Kamptonema cortianum]